VAWERWCRKSEEHIYQRLAFVCRYGNQDYVRAKAIPIRELTPFLQAIGKLVEQENKAVKR
jgi:hypothetical protein